MPRPKSDPNAILELELRITPPSQQSITDWKLCEHITELIMFEEGSPDGAPKLHYHGYVKTTRSKSWIRNWIYDITNAKQYNTDGNSVYFSKQPHEHTFGYIAKCGNCTVRHNVPQTTIDEWLAQSAEYRKQKESNRKRVTRNRTDELQEVYEEIEKDLMDNSTEKYLRTLQAYEIVEKFLDVCYSKGYRFPTRSQLDYLVMKLLYPHNPYAVRSYYAKSFEVKNS